MFRALFILAALSFAGCASKHSAKVASRLTTGQAQSGLPSVQNGRPTDPSGFHRTPIEFLEFLKQSSQETILIFGDNPGWIRDTDIALLMTHLGSQARCAHVKVGVSSHQPWGYTTEGIQAAFLIEGYRQHLYPPNPTSDDFKPDVDELKGWYQEWSTSRQSLR